MYNFSGLFRGYVLMILSKELGGDKLEDANHKMCLHTPEGPLGKERPFHTNR